MSYQTKQITTAAHSERLIKPWLHVVLFVLGWGLLGTLSTVHWRLFRAYDPYTWWELWRIKMIVWYIWGFVTYGIVFLSRRYRMSRHNWVKHLVLMGFCSVVVSLIYLTIYDVALLINLGSPVTWANFQRLFYFYLDYHLSFYYLAFWATIGLEHAYDYFLRFRERELRATRLEAQLAQSRLETLKSKINPHFLFNALNAVSSLVFNKRNDEAYELIARIAELLRHAVKDHDRNEVSLFEELKYVDLYLEIVRIRFRDRLSFGRDISEDIVNASVPSLILQPLVENAVKHGLTSQSDSVHVQINARKRGEQLLVVVSDDGPGLPPDWIPGESRGFGLTSVRERLQNMYGDEQRFEVVNADAKGVEIRMTIPYRTLSATEVTE